MNYSTEIINGIAQQLAEMVKIAVTEQKREEEGTPTIRHIETQMREILRQIGQQTLGRFLSSMQTTPEREIACSCGGTLEYQRIRPATVISVFGKVTYERAYYAGCRCHQGKVPLDEQYGLEPGAVTAGLAELLALTGITCSYDESPERLQKYLLFDVSANTVRSETEEMGKQQEEKEEEMMQQCQSETYLQERQRQPGCVPKRLYGWMDAAKVRIEPRPKKGEEKEAHEDWRDMKTLCWFEVETVPLARCSSRQRKKVMREQIPLRAKNMRYFCDIIEVEAFGKLLWATGCAINADLSPELVFLGDGAVWIWKLVSQYYPRAIQILDWFHAEEHLENVATAAFTTQTERTAWLEQVTQALWEGQVEDVICACNVLAPCCINALQAVTYFTNNMERMRYNRFRAPGYMIGSGTIESACKQIVTLRLKLPGAQWEVDGAVRTAKARAVWLSGHWNSFYPQSTALPLAI
jgi:hypothetical protein